MLGLIISCLLFCFLLVVVIILVYSFLPLSLCNSDKKGKAKKNDP